MSNSPHIYSQSYLGFSPFGIAHSCSKKLINDSKFIDLTNYGTPIHHNFWADFEVNLVSEYDENFTFNKNYRDIYIHLEEVSLIIGRSFADNLLELRRKFPFYEKSFLKQLKIKGIKSVTINNDDIHTFWSRVSKNTVLEGVNFSHLYKDVNCPALLSTFDWLRGSLSRIDSKNDRELISKISIIFLGADHKTMTPMQIFYLSCKLLSPNFYIINSVDLNQKFGLMKNISFPSKIETTDFLYKSSDEFDHPHLELPSYFGRIYSKQFFGLCLNVKTASSETLSTYRPTFSKIFLLTSSLDSHLIKVKVHSFGLTIRYDNILMVFFNSSINPDYKKLLTNEYGDFETRPPRMVGATYFINENGQEVISYNQVFGNGIAALYSKESRDVDVKPLVDSHFVGNISSLFYGR